MPRIALLLLPCQRTQIPDARPSATFTTDAWEPVVNASTAARTWPAGRQRESGLSRPVFAVSMGDPNGVGPEVLLKALHSFQAERSFDPVVSGDAFYLRELAGQLKLEVDWQWVEVVDVGEAGFAPSWGTVCEKAGRLARQSLEGAVSVCRERDCLAIVTAPVNKEALRRAGFRYIGHTDYLAASFGCPASMAFLSARFHVLLATAHIALREVARTLDTDDLVRQATLFYDALTRLQSEPPRIVVCGLNPHASEGGLMGDEEARTIQPAVERLREAFGPEAFRGPLPSDTVFWRVENGEFDGVVALYHDQGLIPLKMVAFDSAVNTTLGLPVVRTSPDHGTAFDIAGRGVADPGSMKEAFRRALQLTRSQSEGSS